MVMIVEGDGDAVVRVAVWLNRYCIDAAYGGEVSSSSAAV
jgi:hypothetical protein